MKNKETACKFAQWIETEFYSLMYQDLNNDGRVWSLYDSLNFEDAERFTIGELYDKFIEEN